MLFVAQNYAEETVFNLTYDPPSQQGPHQLVTWMNASAPPNTASAATPMSLKPGMDGAAQGSPSPNGTPGAADRCGRSAFCLPDSMRRPDKDVGV